MTKRSIKRASADVGMMFTCFNLRRLFNLIDKNVLKEFLGKLASVFCCCNTALAPKCRVIFFVPSICFPENVFYRTTYLPAGRQERRLIHS